LLHKYLLCSILAKSLFQVVPILPAYRNTERQGLLLKGVALLHDNAHLHTAAHTVETLRHLNSEVLEHPPYSTDLTSSDYHLFGPRKYTLRGRHFASDQAVKEVAHAWLVSQPKTFFPEGIKKLVNHWTKCVAKEGHYVEKLCSCKFCIVVVLILKIHCGYFLTHPRIFRT
jgi:hypothetical protein